MKKPTTYVKHKVRPRQPCCTTSPVDCLRYSTNWNRKDWPGWEIKMYYGCLWSSPLSSVHICLFKYELETTLLLISTCAFSVKVTIANLCNKEKKELVRITKTHKLCEQSHYWMQLKLVATELKGPKIDCNWNVLG